MRFHFLLEIFGDFSLKRVCVFGAAHPKAQNSQH